MRRQSALTTLDDALAWLRDVAHELADVPIRLHTHAVQPADLLGSPKLTGAFLAHVTDGPYATREVVREVVCPEAHPIRAASERRCPKCEDTLAWLTATDVYVRPLAAALSTLSRARSRLRPHPRVIVEALLREGCEPERATERIGADMDDRRYLSALRALYDGFSYTAIAARAA